MKKLSFVLALCLCAVLIFSFAPSSKIGASEGSGSEKTFTTYLSDGSYYVTTIYESDAACLSVQQQKSGHKTVEKYNSSGKLLFSLTVRGTFTYDGTTSKAISASYEYTTDAAFWSFSDGSAVCSGNTATAYGTFKHFWVFQTNNISISLSCAPTGTLY